MVWDSFYLCVSIGLAVILILAGGTYNSTRLVTEKTIENHQQQIAADAAKTVDLGLSRYGRIVEATAAAVQQIPIAYNPQILRLLKMARGAGNFPTCTSV